MFANFHGACHRFEEALLTIQDIWMLSLGEGQSNYSLSPPEADSGTLFWSQHGAEVMSIYQI